MMEATTLVERFSEFIEKEYRTQILANSGVGTYNVVMDFLKLAEFDPALADELLENPEETIKAAELTVEEHNDLEEAKKFKVRFHNLPQAARVKVVDSGAAHLGKLVAIVGEVSRVSKRYLNRVSAKFECPSCANIISVLQTSDTFKEPNVCGCGRKGKFRLVSKELTDIQELTIIDAVEHAEEGDRYEELTVVLRDDLTSPEMNRKVYVPNNTVVVVGIFYEKEITNRLGSKSTRADKVFEALYVEPELQQDKEFNPTDKEVEEFKQLASEEGFYQKVVDAVAPNIYGHDVIKEALLLQLIGGVRRHKKDGSFRRGDVHICLIGDPSTGKSELILRATSLLPRSMFVSGKGTSGVGVGGGVKKNAYVEGFTADPGAMAMANHSVLGLDELDKIDKEHIEHLNNGMEQQFVTIDKAGVHARFNTQTRVLAGANPKFGRFDPYSNLAEQFDIPAATLSRMDLVFPMQDVPDEKKDAAMSDFILKSDLSLKEYDVEENPFFEINNLRKFIQAVTHLKPEFTDEALEMIKNYYVTIRNANGGSRDRQAPVAIGARQLQALQRLSEAYAKIHFSEKVKTEHAQKAVQIMDYYLKQVCTDPETGKIDIDRIATGITTTQRNQLLIMEELLAELENTVGKLVPIEDLTREALNKGLEQARIDELIEKMKRTGDIMEPRHGFIQRL